MATWNLIKAIELTSAESSAGLVSGDIKSAAYPPGHVYRYVNNANPGGGDVTTEWQTFLSLGGIYDLDARVDDIFYVTGQFVIKANTTLRMGQQCVILRDWGGTTGNRYENAQFINENAPSGAELIIDPGPWVPDPADDNIYIEGGRIRPADSDAVGGGYYMMGTENLRMRDNVVERSYEEWAFAIGGENFDITGIRVEENAEVYEDGVHVLYGSGTIEADYIHSGDDAFAVGTNYNLPVDGVTIKMGRFYSSHGHAIRVLQERGGSTAAFATSDQIVQNVRFHSGSGFAGTVRNGLAWTETDAAGLLRDISVDGVTVDHGTETHSGANPYGMYFVGVTRLRLSNVTAKNVRRHSFHIKECPQAQLIGCHGLQGQGASSFRALEIEDCIDMRVVGGEYTKDDAAVVRLTSGTTNSVVFDGVLISDIADSLPGIAINGTSDVTLNGVTFRKKSGATSSRGVTLATTTTSLVGDGCVWDVDHPIAVSGTPAYASLSKIRKTFTIASGTVNSYGCDYISLLCEGGTSDTLSVLTGGYPGQVVTLVNGEAAPGTAVVTLAAGTGSNEFNIGTDYELDSAAESIMLRFNGTNWSQISPTKALTSAYTPTNVSTDRAYNANSTSVEELADVLGTLIADLQARQILG